MEESNQLSYSEYRSKNLLIAFWYGLAILAPWNAVLSTLDFFEAAMPTHPISFIVTFAMNGFMVLVILVCLNYSEVGSHAQKVNFVFLIQSVLLVLLPYLVHWLSSNYSENTCFWVTNALLVLLGALSAIAQSTVFSYLSKMPPRYIQVCSIAFGAVALTQNAIRAVILHAVEDKLYTGTLIYYFVSMILLLIAAALYFFEKGDDFAQHYIQQAREASFVVQINSDDDEKAGSFLKRSATFSERMTSFFSVSKKCLKYAWIPLFHVGFGNFVTFVVFPGVTDATTIGNLNRVWFELVMVFVFNISDTLGLVIASLFQQPSPAVVQQRYMLIHLISFSRLAFLTVALLIMLQVWILPTAWIIILNQSLFGLTNGMVQNLCYPLAPLLVGKGRDQEVIGNLIVIFVSLGISFGSAIQIPLAQIDPLLN